MAKVKFKDIAVFINGDRGKNYPSQNEILDSGEYLFINAGHIDNYGICLENMNYISKEKYDLLNSGKIQANDILYCLRGSLGKKALIKHGMNGAIASSLVIIRLDDSKAYNKFIMYALDSPNIIAQQYKANNGSSQPNLSASSVKDYEFVLPNIGKQKQIAANLDKVTHTIDLCNNILEKLDLLVKSRFVEMFGEPISNSMGWDCCELGACLESIDNGKSYVCDNNCRIGDNPAILKLSAVTYGIYNPDENKAMIDADLFDESAEVKDNDLLFTRKNTPELVGMSAYVFSTPPKLMMPDLIFRLNAKTSCNKIYLWQLINHDLFRPCIQNIANGSAKSMSNISKERLSKLTIPVPPLALQEQFAAFVEQTDKSKSAVKQVLEKAETLKKALMQEYFG